MANKRLLKISVLIAFTAVQIFLFAFVNRQINPDGKKVSERFITPAGFKRKNHDGNSFEYFLSNFKLKPHGSVVRYFDGKKKEKENVYLAVLDLDIGKKDLQQCADAVIRLRAEYMYAQKQYDVISFNFTSGFKCDYKKWKEGFRPSVNGNNVSWVKRKEPENSYASFFSYMETVFTYAGTLSLSKELQKVPLKEMKIGDVLIQGGSPGHAVIVMDMAEDSKGNKVFMLAQSYMPAQDIQILVNPDNNSPWYQLDESKEVIRTPEWNFTTNDLKRFR
jgi:hypothetical protein